MLSEKTKAYSERLVEFEMVILIKNLSVKLVNYRNHLYLKLILFLLVSLSFALELYFVMDNGFVGKCLLIEVDSIAVHMIVFVDIQIGVN